MVWDERTGIENRYGNCRKDADLSYIGGPVQHPDNHSVDYLLFRNKNVCLCVVATVTDEKRDLAISINYMDGSVKWKLIYYKITVIVRTKDKPYCSLNILLTLNSHENWR